MTACSVEDAEAPREAAIRPVKLLKLSSVTEPQISRYPGVVAAVQFAQLSFPVGGRIAEIAVSSGQQINEGDTIVRLDQRDFQSRASAARSAFQNAEEQYQRTLQLSKRDAVAASVLDTRKQLRDTARSELDVAEKALEDSTLVAPFPGHVSQIPIRENQLVSAGQIVASVQGQTGAEVTIDLPARVMARWQEVENAIASVTVDSGDDRSFEASYQSADLLADNVSQTYKITFSFNADGDYLVLPGMAATVELRSSGDTPSGPARISVPLTAVLNDGTNEYVWVVNETSMQVSRLAVSIVPGLGETVFVTDGLQGDETIAIAGASFLDEGMTVRPWRD